MADAGPHLVSLMIDFDLLKLAPIELNAAGRFYFTSWIYKQFWNFFVNLVKSEVSKKLANLECESSQPLSEIIFK